MLKPSTPASCHAWNLSAICSGVPATNCPEARERTRSRKVSEVSGADSISPLTTPCMASVSRLASGASRSIAPRSTPTLPLMWASPPSTLDCATKSAALAAASASVPPTTGVTPWKKRMSSGFRPRRAARARMSRTTPADVRRLRMEANMKTHSAWAAANSRPRSDEPAWKSSGVRCGEGSARCGPLTE